MKNLNNLIHLRFRCCYFPFKGFSFNFYILFQELGAVSLDGYFHLWKAEHNLCKVRVSKIANIPLIQFIMLISSCKFDLILIFMYCVFPLDTIHQAASLQRECVSGIWTRLVCVCSGFSGPCLFFGSTTTYKQH